MRNLVQSHTIKLAGNWVCLWVSIQYGWESTYRTTATLQGHVLTRSTFLPFWPELIYFMFSFVACCSSDTSTDHRYARTFTGALHLSITFYRISWVTFTCVIRNICRSTFQHTTRYTHWISETLTWHKQTVMQDRHKVRVCISVVHLLADEIKNLRGTFGVYVYLERKKSTALSVSAVRYLQSYKYCQVRIGELLFLYLPTQSVSIKPAHPHSAASQSSLNAWECEKERLH